MSGLNWQRYGPGRLIASHDGWTYMVRQYEFSYAAPGAYSARRIRHMGEPEEVSEMICGAMNRAPDLDAAKLACEKVAFPDAAGEVQASPFGPAQQAWVTRIPIMQQSVLFAAIRAPDGIRKNHPVKVLMRWYRRCVLLSAFDKRALLDPLESGGGSFTGPFGVSHCYKIFGSRPSDNCSLLDYFHLTRNVYLDHVDELPHHFQLHLMHAAQIVGVHHSEPWVRAWWYEFYLMIVDDAHLMPESDRAMNERLSDNCEAWLAREVRTAS